MPRNASTATTCIKSDFVPKNAYTLLLANHPFNDTDLFSENNYVRWQFDIPHKGNSNFACTQHFIHHLAPKGMAGFFLTNSSMFSNQSDEGDIHCAIIEADLVDTAFRASVFPQSVANPQVLRKAKNNTVPLPGKLLCSTQIPVYRWFLVQNATAYAKHTFSNPHKQILVNLAELAINNFSNN